nr:carboxypeptidase-like regulatory domain-containing protein [Dysgonomonas sp. 521]
MNIDYITVSGVVKDKKTKKKLEYVSISVPGTNVGTITNVDGEFSIKIKDSLQTRGIDLSRIGYLNYHLSLSGKDQPDVTVYLTANDKALSEVVIEQADVYQIVESAISKIETNYSDKANLLTGFYRETVKKGRGYINITEAIINIYKTPYKDDIAGDRVQIYKGRKLLSPKVSDTLIVKLIGGPTQSVSLDIVKSRDAVLFDMETIRHFAYKDEGTIMIDERPHYVIGFTPRVILPYALYEGRYYIDKQNLTLSRTEFNLDMSDRNKATQAVLIKKPPKLHFKPEEVSFEITYKQHNGRSYLNYIRNDIRFKCDWKKKFFFFSTNYEVVSEMVVTDRQEEDVAAISRKAAFKQNQSLSDKVGNFSDEYFWEDYNIIEPTESLESAVNKLKKKYE